MFATGNKTDKPLSPAAQSIAKLSLSIAFYHGLVSDVTFCDLMSQVGGVR